MADQASNGGSPPGAPEPLAVTSAGEFRRVRELGVIVELPTTKRIVRLRAVKPAALLRLGKIPDPLSELVIHVLYGQLNAAEYAAFFELRERKEQALDYAESLRVVCTAALIEPRIVDEPSAPDEIHIDDLEDGEQFDIFNLALFKGAIGLSRFRLEQSADVEPVAQEQEPELQAE